MAVPTFHAAGTGAFVAGGTTTDIAVPYPTVTAADVLILHLVEKNAGWAFELPTTPSGWTALFGPDYLDDGTQGRSWAFSKVATGSETGSLTVSSSDLHNYRMARMYSFSGASGASEAGNLASSDAGAMTCPALVTTGVDRLGVALVSTVNVQALASFTGETGGDWTEAVAEYTPNGSLQLQTAAMAAAGTLAGGGQTVTGQDWAVRVFALLAGSPASTGSYLGVPLRGVG